jgi:hypothetical protein
MTVVRQKRNTTNHGHNGIGLRIESILLNGAT